MVFNYYQWREERREFPCAFAKLIVSSLGPSALFFKEASATAPDEIAAQIDSFVSDALRTTARVLTVHVPAWDEQKMAETFRALRATDGWRLKLLKPINFGQRELVPVGVHREIKTKAGDAPAVETVPMVLGPYVLCPPSRYCPEPILEMSIDATCVSDRLKDGRARADFLALPTPRMTGPQRERQKGAVKSRSREINKGIEPRLLANVTATISPELAALL